MFFVTVFSKVPPDLWPAAYRQIRRNTPPCVAPVSAQFAMPRIPCPSESTNRVWDFITANRHQLERPSLILVMGPPGSGKSTLCNGLLKQISAAYLDIDSVAAVFRQHIRKVGPLKIANLTLRTIYPLAEQNLTHQISGASRSAVYPGDDVGRTAARPARIGRPQRNGAHHQSLQVFGSRAQAALESSGNISGPGKN